MPPAPFDTAVLETTRRTADARAAGPRCVCAPVVGCDPAPTEALASSDPAGGKKVKLWPLRDVLDPSVSANEVFGRLTEEGDPG
jgi:hypothetical protein